MTMRFQFFLLMTIVLTAFLAACGSAATPAPTIAPAKITLITRPNPPSVGEVELVFTLVDEKGQPITGADFDVFADHTDMSGMTMHGKASDQGNGNYAVMTNFSMTGNWKLSVQVRTESLDFKQDMNLKIQ